MITLERFRQQLQSLGQSVDSISSYLVGFSGGVDSHVLLHLCHRAGITCRAVHVNHGLQDLASEWSRHCQTVCAELGVELVVLDIDATAQTGESPEDAARKARYTAFRAELRPSECLLTAQHADDQAETLLLQLMRGAGPAGLAAMPGVREFGAGWHARPLLEFSREEIVAYANAELLGWVEDPSNKDPAFDRNLLRQDVLPLLRARWPSAVQSISRSAQFQQESLELIEALARIDLAAVSTPQPTVLSINLLHTLPRARQLNLLRYWLKNLAGASPSHNVLTQLVDKVLLAKQDARPVLRWQDKQLRRFQQHLYLLPEYTAIPAELSLKWDGKSSVNIGERVVVRPVMNCTPGLDIGVLDKDLSLRFRHSGESLKVYGKSHHQRLKKLMYEAGIPPWQRGMIPLLYVNDELACVCGYWFAEPFAAARGAPGWLPECQYL